MAHVRRRFVDVHLSLDSPIAEEAIWRISWFYAVEKKARGSRLSAGRRSASRKPPRYSMISKPSSPGS